MANLALGGIYIAAILGFLICGIICTNRPVPKAPPTGP